MLVPHRLTISLNPVALVRLGIAAFFILAVVCLPLEAAAGASPEEGAAFFEKSIRPVFVRHCYECHSTEAAAKGMLKAELSLDTRDGLLTGGESGPAIVAGSPDKSLLIQALKYQSYEMPPSGRLPPAVIADFEKWVEMGAPDPRDATAAAPTPRRAAFAISPEDRAHWSFQEVRRVEPPKVKQADWVRDDLDRFILAGVERAGLRPSPPADKYALLRRTTFALTGLPPTPEEITAFAADDDPRALEKVIDRQLASSEFGVHWGRRWLDGVRYADNIDKSGEYRRWVIRAFNEDLPYDRFVRLQIAGDLLPAGSDVPADRVHASGASFDGVTAAGMMSLAVWEQVGRDLAVAEIVDSQIDLVGRQLLGLTLACARCHDHKFDPISTQDYYALAGILFSSHIATGKLIADDRLGNDLIEVPLLTAKQAKYNAEVDSALAKLEQQIDALAEKVPQAARLADLNVQAADLAKQEAEAKSSTDKKKAAESLAKLKAELEKLSADQARKKWDRSPPELDEIAGLRAKIASLQKTKIAGRTVVSILEGGVPGSNRQKIGDAPVYLRGEYQREGPIVPRRFPTILAGERQKPLGEQTKESGRRELADWVASARNPLTARVMVNRIWQQMIGRGLVRSPDNFGKLGERPTHPELLDHLAVRFVESGWSVKSLVRQIALSSTFGQASFASPEVARMDPENVHVSHGNRRRLTYEELRDSLLHLGGKLAEGSATPTTPDGEDACRRTMFSPVDRRKIDATAAIFDGPDSKSIVPMRAESTTAAQALFLLNNELTLETAKKLAGELTKDGSAPDDRKRLERLWLLALGRPPGDDEIAGLPEFVAEHGWERLVQAVLGTNEFTYLD
jgi:hypothetical protein